MKPALTGVLVLMAVAACNGSPGLMRTVPSVATIGPAEAAACTYVADLRTRPGMFGPLAQQGLEDARYQTLLSAQEAGANAVVFEPVSPGAQVYEIMAKAYRC